jgi:hypothetical protein
LILNYYIGIYFPYGQLMIIKDVRLNTTAGSTTLSATCKIRSFGWDTIYFKVDAANQAYLSGDASPFAAALLLPAMKKKEDLVIHGTISKQLLEGMQAIMKEVSGWGIGLHPITITADHVAEDSYSATKSACFFSGGVDSFYTYLKHKHSKIPGDQINSLILVNNGFDVDPRNKRLWQDTVASVQAIADAESVELVIVESNVNTHELLAPIVTWDYLHGACLAATGLALRAAFRQIYIASTHSTEEQIPWGSNLALDANWSTEKITFTHDGSETNRLNKVVTQIAKSPVALKYLRVCYMNTDGAYNCGTCDKCMRTMVNLYIAGVLDKSQTLPTTLDIHRIANTPTIRGKDGGIFHTENITALKEKKLNPSLQKALRHSLEITDKSDEQKHSLREAVIRIDHDYCRGSLYLLLSNGFGRKFTT